MANPSESGHWYRKDGTPCYTIIGKNGKERPTTLRDARKLNLVPSVTTIMACAARPGLDAWKIDQTILACLTLPKIEGESEAEYIARIKTDSKAQAEKAAERGTQIHAWIQMGFEGEDYGEGSKYFESALNTITNECCVQSWVVEKSFAYPGFGGKCDIHNDDYLIDIKTTDKDLGNIKTWDEHAMQLAAYDYGLGFKEGTVRKCGILYINVNTAESKLIWIQEDELKRGFNCFMALLDFWYAKTGLGGEND